MLLLETFVEVAFGAGLFINSVLFVPQIIRLVQTKNSDELSLVTFCGFWLIQLASVLHGFFKHDYILMYGFILSLITCGAVNVLIIYYRRFSSKEVTHVST